MVVKAYKYIRNLLILFIVFTQFSCLKGEDPFEEYKAKEKLLIDNYISANGANARLSTSGLYYIEIKEGTGDSVKVNDEAIFTYYAYKLETPDKLFDTSDKDFAKTMGLNITYTLFDGPPKIMIGWFYSAGVSQGLLAMKEGGRAKFVIPGSLVFGDYVPYLFEVTLHKVVKDARKFELAQIDSFFVQNKIFKEGNDTLFKTHKDSIPKSIGGVSDMYFASHTLSTDSAIRRGDSVKLKYSVCLLPYIDRSKNLNIPERIVFPEETISIKIGSTSTQPFDNEGFNGIIVALKNKEKAKVIIPFHQAYKNAIFFDSETTQRKILQNSTLIYNLEILNVIKNK